MDTKNHSKNIPAKKSCDQSRLNPSDLPNPCGPLKNRSKDPRSQDWEPRSQDWEPSKALETLHWCLAAWWRTLRTSPKNLWLETSKVGLDGTKTKRQARRKVTSHFFVTLLTHTDDPNTFELVARNLKMKARINSKNNEASQIKSSPHDAENH